MDFVEFTAELASNAHELEEVTSYIRTYVSRTGHEENADTSFQC